MRYVEAPDKNSNRKQLTHWILYVRAAHGLLEFDTVGLLEVYTGFVVYAGTVMYMLAGVQSHRRQ